ncbi:MAG: 30S ribosome-binding factor RbfA [Candidatus Omnitrophica bacterium]|nr:30S ribosome-binding factor RbfA [Candidatus Omnitrophota bacterium]
MSRMDKVNQQVRREIGLIIQQEMSDPRLQFVAITRVDVSKDLRTARVFFNVIGDSKKILDAKNALQSARGAIRRKVGQKIKMRFTPEFSFFYDDSMDIANRIEDTLKEINDETKDDPQSA